MIVYNFDAEIARIYGVDNAVMIWNLQYWIEHNEANGKHFYNGRTWTYNSVDAYSKIFPFWSKGQIRRILNSLEEKGVIVTGNFNEDARVRTTWYAFTDSFQQMHLSKSANGIIETEKCREDSININNTTKQIKNTDNKAAEGDLFPSSSEPVTTSKPRRTSEALCLFENSRYADFQKFESEFTAPEFSDIDIAYYYHAVADWSAQKGKKMRDWIATARNFIRGDMEKGKLHRLSSERTLPPSAIKYLEMGMEL